MPGYVLILDLVLVGVLCGWLAKDPMHAILAPLAQFMGIGFLVGLFTPTLELGAKFAMNAEWSLPITITVISINGLGVLTAYLFGSGHEGERHDPAMANPGTAEVVFRKKAGSTDLDATRVFSLRPHVKPKEDQKKK